MRLHHFQQHQPSSKWARKWSLPYDITHIHIFTLLQSNWDQSNHHFPAFLLRFINPSHNGWKLQKRSQFILIMLRFDEKFLSWSFRNRNNDAVVFWRKIRLFFLGLLFCGIFKHSGRFDVKWLFFTVWKPQKIFQFFCAAFVCPNRARNIWSLWGELKGQQRCSSIFLGRFTRLLWLL